MDFLSNLLRTTLDALALFGRTAHVILPVSVAIHWALFYLFIHYPTDPISFSWTVAFILAIYPIRVSLVYSILDSAAKGRGFLEGLADGWTADALVAQFLNNFLWWGYTPLVFLLLNPFLPENPELATHLVMLLLAVSCVPTAFVDCAALFERASFGAACRASWTLTAARPLCALFAYLIFWEGLNYIPEHLEAWLRRFIEDDKLRATATLTLTLSPLYAFVWTQVFTCWRSERRD